MNGERLQPSERLISCRLNGFKISRPQFPRILAPTFIVLILLFSNSSIFAADSPSTVSQSSLVVPYKGTLPKGPFKFPLYTGEGFQYFSAGIGLEERQANYPPYPLKFILVQGDRAYLSTVSLKIRQLDGSLTFQIPSKHVEGPWIFLKMPTGTYLVTATNHQQRTI